jgi:hypothetical protein
MRAVRQKHGSACGAHARDDRSAAVRAVRRIAHSGRQNGVERLAPRIYVACVPSAPAQRIARQAENPKEVSMKVKHHKRIRVFRRLAIAGCMVAGLAVPAGAMAMVPNDTASPAAQPYSLPSSFHTEVQATQQQQQQYSLPSSFRTEIQTDAQPSPVHQYHAPAQPSEPNPTTKAIALRRAFNPADQPSSAPTPAVVRQIETVSDDSGKTLAIVLAAVALAVALGSLGYATVRLTQIQRRELGSGSH